MQKYFLTSVSSLWTTHMLLISSMVLSLLSTIEPKCTGAFKTFIGPLLVLALLGLKIFNNSLQINLKRNEICRNRQLDY